MQFAIVLAFATALPLIAAAQGTESYRGRNLAASCANCHNTNGSSVAGTPSIAGMSREALLAALMDYKAGRRAATVMHQLARGYTDAELESIAAYFAAQK
ncbi:MAG: cytochrome C [Proteobacteria bacterium]|nr:cytochrome C [Pseudomonadota bacterium]